MILLFSIWFVCGITILILVAKQNESLEGMEVLGLVLLSPLFLIVYLLEHLYSFMRKKLNQ